MSNDFSTNKIRAYYTSDFVRVYQAYSDAIADSALKNDTFVSPPFNMRRMTWIKPSFLWMMYRSHWGTKDSGQKRILAIDITHNGFNEMLQQSIINSHDENNNLSPDGWKDKIKNSDVIIQWDPERDIHLNKLNYRTIQIGLRNKAVENYVNEWIVKIQDVTALATDIHSLVLLNDLKEAMSRLPPESEYPFLCKK
ncbi:DUF4291 domain-containing protein [Citrobacter sp. wls619]|uniref:DUF4291 domain-containing protein n=1 Tax=Citrobacter sp. wls619 TaxID=2576432 RepID=UPI0010C983F4|nr:DUF4291 domain-containing protein [Citrobacter sp. wls619]TKV14565.1 DUF4291 domain-containing protein [Citrobacter sp. wls619]